MTVATELTFEIKKQSETSLSMPHKTTALLLMGGDPPSSVSLCLSTWQYVAFLKSFIKKDMSA